MNYTVVWIPSAEAEMARLWTVAIARSAIASAADEIDDILGRTPYDVGESREWPLAVSYVVRDDDRLVQVQEVWRYDT